MEFEWKVMLVLLVTELVLLVQEKEVLALALHFFNSN